MKLSTEKISLLNGISDQCGNCKALRAAVEMRGDNLRWVDVHCDLADIIVDGDIKQVRAKAKKVLGHELEPNAQYECESLNDAADLLAHPPKEEGRRLRPEPQGVVEASGPKRYRPGHRPEVVVETDDGSSARRWLATKRKQARKKPYCPPANFDGSFGGDRF